MTEQGAYKRYWKKQSATWDLSRSRIGFLIVHCGQTGKTLDELIKLEPSTLHQCGSKRAVQSFQEVTLQDVSAAIRTFKQCIQHQAQLGDLDKTGTQ